MAVPRDFAPTVELPQLQQAIQLYKQNPDKFSDQDLSLLKNHAEYYHIPFAEDEESHQGRVSGLLSQLGSGFVSGFSTFNVGKAPRDEYESIARNLGHLAGFVGFVPAKPFQLLKMYRLAGAAKALKGKSIPMVAAKMATEKAGKLVGGLTGKAVTARAGAAGDAMSFLGKPLVKDLVEGSFHLGVASAVSSWQEGIDGMMEGFIGGAQTGLVFRGIGNFIRTGDKGGDKVLRGLASSLFTGLPATMAGATTPEQIYEYLLGAYFGVKEAPYHRRAAGRHIEKMTKKGSLEPETVEGWEVLDAKTQKTVQDYIKNTEIGDTAQNAAVAYQLLVDGGMSPEKAQKEAARYVKEYKAPEISEEGELLSPEKLTESEKTKVLEETKRKDTDLSNHRDDVDVGTDVQRFTVQTENFVRENLEKIWKGTKTPRSNINVASSVIETKWKEFYDNAREVTKKNPSDEIIDFIETKYKTTLKQRAKDWWRQQGEVRLKARPVKMLSGVVNPYKGTNEIIELEFGIDTNLAGNRKRLLEPSKLLDFVYKRQYEQIEGKDYDPVAVGRPYMVLDHVVMHTSKGLKEVPMSRIAQEFESFIREQTRKENPLPEYEGKWSFEDIQSEARVRANRVMSDTILEMNKKGYYYFGGKGDAARKYFVKYHPLSENKRGEWNSIESIQAKAFKMPKTKVKKEINEDIKRWAKGLGLDPKAPETIQLYRDAYTSNVLYELGMNGFEGIENPRVFKERFEQVLGKGYINSPKNFNKRSQIWFTTGFSSNPEYIANRVKDLTDGKYNVRIVEDSELHEMYSDGAILGRSDVLDTMNSDWGMPTEGRANKSFIVSPHAEHGALLGKYMLHEPSSKIGKWMKDNNIHMIIPVSAAKQYGTRKVGKEHYDKATGKYSIKGGRVHTIEPENFKGIFSEKVDRHSAEWQRLPKQMSTNLTPFNFNPTKADAAIIEDMYNTLNRRSFLGEESWNKKLEKLIESPELFESMEAELEANFDKLGISNVIKGIQSKGNERFANLAYAKVQKVQKTEIEKAVAEGEMTVESANEALNELETTLQIHEKIKMYAPNSLLSVFHKWSFPYLETSLRNYIVQTLTKPRVANSFSSRMRPYDMVMQNEGETKRLAKEKDLFFLDDGFKKVKIKSSFWEGETKTLEEVWELYKDKPGKGLKKELESILEATVVRVPMDSMSGAHVLKFGGFTGIKGYGSLLNKETMKALGGADLDGDKAFGFFGSNEYGFKNSWKDLYKRQREEYKGKSPEQAKEDYRKELAIQDKDILDMVKSPIMQYSPYVRNYVSDAAATGRNQLGPGVNSRAVINAAYSALRSMREDKKNVNIPWSVDDPKGRPDVYLELLPRTSKAAMQKFREKARAIIALTSDPMDEAGLRGTVELYNSLFNEAFRFKPYYLQNKKKVYVGRELAQIGSQINNSETFQNQRAVGLAKGAFVKTFKDVADRLFSSNISEGKRWTFEEIYDTMEQARSSIPENSRNTLFAKLPVEMSNTQWSDHLLGRVDYNKLADMYDLHQTLVGDNKYQTLMENLSRKSMRVPMGRYLDLVRKYKLHTERGRNSVLNSDKMDYDLGGKRVDKKTKKVTEQFLITEMEGRGYEIWKNGDESVRKPILDRMLNKATDFIINDMSDIASMKTSLKYFEPLTNRPQWLEIIEKVKELKAQSYLMGRNRRDMQKVTSSNLSEKQKKLLEEMDREYGDAPISALADQHTIDMNIRQYKKKLTPAERDFFDSLMLGSVNKGSHEIIDRYKERARNALKGKDKPTREFWKRFDEIVKKGDNTSMSRLGFASQEVSPKVMREYMKEFSDLFDNASTKLSKSETNRLKEEALASDKPRPIVDENGNVVKGSLLESAEYDEATQKYLDEYAPFVGLKEGTLKGEHKELFYKLKNHLEFYHNGIGKNLNGLVRHVLGKDMNAMNLSDFRTLDRYFTQLRTGTWWQSLSEKLGSKFPQLSKWDYLRFPEAVSRNILRKEMSLVDSIRPYKDMHNNVIMGTAKEPVAIVDKLQNLLHGSQENAIRVYEDEKKGFRDELRPYLESIEGGNEFFELAVRKMETGMMSTEKANYDYTDLNRKAEKKYNWNELKNKSFLVTTLERGKVEMTGEQIRQKIMDTLEARNEKIHKWLAGEPEKLEAYENIITTTLEENPKKYHLELLELKRKFIKDVEDSFSKNKAFDIGLGMDGLSRISKLVLMSQVPDYNRIERQKAIQKLAVDPTGELPFKHYFPHIQFDRVKAQKKMLETIENVAKDNSLTKQAKADKMQSLLFHYKQLTGDWSSLEQSRFGQHWDKIAEAANAITEKKKKKDQLIDWFKAVKKVRNQYSRSKEPIPGWEVSPEAYESYMKGIIDSYYRLTSEVTARSGILDWRQDFYNRSKDKNLTNSWANYLNLYVQGGMGYNDKVPRRWLEKDSDMKIHGTPYSWFADSTVLNRINKIADKLGVQKGKALPKEFKELGKFSFEDLSRWTNMEAKYQLASLLAHPKSAVANLYGGTVHTVISTGWDNFKKGRSIKHLQTNVNPKWSKMADVEEWVKGHGVIEEFLLYEADINPKMKGKKWKDFVKEAAAKINKDPEFSDVSLRELWRKHGITDSMFNKAAWFMRRPERTLRRDSFVAHYLQAREKYGDAIRDYDHPFLIEQAKKGVKATQFLYSAPFRPMFARTALGKVMTRFQLWAWNSVRFRNQVLREAELKGWKPGTQEFERYKRLATTDLFTLGLGSVFMYSIFENALPAPWNWFQDVSDLMFGDDKDRERAFFGAYPAPFQPLQMVTPPAARILPPLFKGLVTDDYSKLSEYYVWTMFPFGRFARDVVGPRGLLQNPAYGVEKLTGIPYTKFASELKGTRVEKEGLEIPKPRGIF